METETLAEGWAFPTANARKPHYFRGPELRSLCGKYALFKFARSRLEPDTGATVATDCASCARKLEASR